MAAVVTSILIIEQESQGFRELEALLQREGFTVNRLSSVAGSGAGIARVAPSLVVLELAPGGWGSISAGPCRTTRSRETRP